MASRRAHLGVVRPLLGPVGSRGSAPPPSTTSANCARGTTGTGIELDWQRHGFHLPADEAYRLRYTITDLQRAARQVTDRTGEQRGRPLCLAARVAQPASRPAPTSATDVETWLQEDLVDLLIGGGGAATDPRGRGSSGSRSSAGRAGVPFYPGFDSGPARSLGRPRVRGPQEPPAHARHRRPPSPRRRRRHLPLQLALRREGASARNDAGDRRSGDTRAAGQGLRRDPSPPRLRGALARGPTATTAAADRCRFPCVPTLTGRGPVVDVETAESGTPLAAELRLHLKEVGGRGRGWQCAGTARSSEDPEVSYNLPGSDADQHSFAVPVSQVSSDVWLRYPLAPDILGSGLHRVEAILRKRHPQLASDLILTDVEIAVAWSSAVRSRPAAAAGLRAGVAVENTGLALAANQPTSAVTPSSLQFPFKFIGRYKVPYR